MHITDIPSGNVAFGLWEIVLLFAVIIFVLGIISCFFAFFKPNGADGIRKTINGFINFLFYAVLVFIAVESILTGAYGRIFILAAIVIAVKWNQWFGSLIRLGGKGAEKK